MIQEETPPNGVFLSDMTEDEHQEYVENEERGWGGFKKLLGIKK